MVRLTGPDLQLLLRSVQMLHSGSPDALLQNVLESAAFLLPSAAVIYRDTDLQTNEAVYVAHSGDAAAFAEAFKTHFRQHPLIATSPVAEERVRSISEVVAPREFHRLELYE